MYDTNLFPVRFFLLGTSLRNVKKNHNKTLRSVLGGGGGKGGKTKHYVVFGQPLKQKFIFFYWN